MEQDILDKLNEQNGKIEAIYRSVEKTRKYIFWTFIFNLIVFLLPLVSLIIAVLWFLKILSSFYDLK